MSNELTAAILSHNVLPEVILAQVQDAIYSESIMLPLMDQKSVAGAGSNVAAYQFAPTTTAGAVTDGTALSNGTWTLTNKTITASEIGKKMVLTDFGASSTVSDIASVISRNLSQGLLEKFETDACALLGGFSNTVGTTTAALTVADLVSAINTLRKNAKVFTQSKIPVMVLYPEQIYDIQVEALNKTAGLAPALGRESIVGLMGDRPGDNLMSAMVGSFMGVAVFSHNLVPTANTAADSAGALFLAGEAGALGAAMKWEPSIEMQRTVVDGIKGTAVMASMAYGVGELRDEFGVSIITDR